MPFDLRSFRILRLRNDGAKTGERGGQPAPPQLDNGPQHLKTHATTRIGNRKSRLGGVEQPRCRRIVSDKPIFRISCRARPSRFLGT